ncbi:ABC-type Fe3+/spermidine/putrescine transport system ATPase subunit [Chryseobacterium jejuense]|nr:ABC-type Fe3+/spermidine/putrescine transport system ATPase subunit [Chryseobacterium jejuense]
MSEQDTLDNINDLIIEKKSSKEEKEAARNVESWAKYAFENNKEYHIMIFNDEKPLAYINNNYNDITVELLTYNGGNLFNYLSLVYDKFNMEISFKEDRDEPFPNNDLFLSQVNSVYEDDLVNVQNELVFKLNGNTNIFETTFDKKTNKSKTEAKKTKVNVSHNFIRRPQNYKDYEYLLDYKNILMPEFLDLK